MLELMWCLIASIPFLLGLSFVLLAWQGRRQKGAAQAWAGAARR